MVLRCEVPAFPGGGIISAWQAVERRQRARADSCYLISQPDHAALAGALAAQFVSPHFPALDPLVVRAIAVHDSGWALFAAEADPSAPPLVDGAGKPLSFLDITPADFVRAWSASIDRAEEICPAGGVMVSTHFQCLCRHRLGAANDTAEDRSILQRFEERETTRIARLLPAAKVTAAQAAVLTEVLQFCDLLSLYLCCGATEEVEFPQNFASMENVRGRYEGGAFHLQPSPFQRDRVSDPNAQGISLGVRASRWDAAAGRTKVGEIGFLLW